MNDNRPQNEPQIVRPTVVNSFESARTNQSHLIQPQQTKYYYQSTNSIEPLPKTRLHKITIGILSFYIIYALGVAILAWNEGSPGAGWVFGLMIYSGIIYGLCLGVYLLVRRFANRTNRPWLRRFGEAKASKKWLIALALSYVLYFLAEQYF
jgi:hypothetical protein